ncbi:uncharacterized protein K460DRAFT_115176 [Cucurbitaria berberidis CBS 394.84]|uniref:Uncharacterized protein n=1 Tax=Cucurbitaria berberidis CBS 394.84 TaxID=1168544 RepID=A0A9P4GID7_9PLEO|nr:uncharacterized protein K460DRAFT_115176 [Cucurbitaria berberidis CBS 394.84]KAF1845784.1 hypothetical protein K460DRAFT_115176 [Cucurbitaria berberidis CBS 394.84]
MVEQRSASSLVVRLMSVPSQALTSTGLGAVVEVVTGNGRKSGLRRNPSLISSGVEQVLSWDSSWNESKKRPLSVPASPSRTAAKRV